MDETRIEQTLEKLTPEYWRALNPALTISIDRKPDKMAIREADFADGCERMRNEGYFIVPSALPPSTLDLLKQAMITVEQDGWPNVFAFLYDAPWLVARSSPVLRLVTDLLGPDARQLADFWAWHVRPTSRGFRPHREVGDVTLFGNADPKSLTLWVPVTDATLDNSCMYVLPLNLENEGVSEEHMIEEYGPDPCAWFLLHRARALPAPAGSLLTWNHYILHWGSCCSGRAPENRRSLGYEFIRGDIDPLFHPHTTIRGFETPRYPLVLDPNGPLPTFEERLYFLAKNLWDYAAGADGIGGDGPFFKAVARRMLAEPLAPR